MGGCLWGNIVGPWVRRPQLPRCLGSCALSARMDRQRGECTDTRSDPSAAAGHLDSDGYRMHTGWRLHSKQEPSIKFDAFSTESGYDFLTMSDGQSYSGSSGPPSGTYSGTFFWSSDFSVTNSGWKLCKA